MGQDLCGGPGLFINGVLSRLAMFLLTAVEAFFVSLLLTSPGPPLEEAY